MPILEFVCPENHVTELLIRNRKEADTLNYIKCKCQLYSKRKTSSGNFFMHGSPGGYSKPSPCAKRIVNPDSISYQGTGVVNTNNTSINID